MHRISFIIIIFINISFLKSQNITANMVMQGYEEFLNTEYISSQKIKTIKGDLHYKRPMKPMYPRDRYFVYHFDEKGRMTKVLDIFKNHEKVFDTLATFYEYNDFDLLITKRETDNFGFFSTRYLYNDKKQVVSEVFLREVNALKSKSEFELKKDYVVAQEDFKMSYSPDGNVVIRKVMNDVGNIYKTIEYMYENNMLVEEIKRYVLTGAVEKTKFELDESGKLIKKFEEQGLMEKRMMQSNYIYNENNLLVEVDIYKNDVQYHHKEFLRNEETKLATAKIDNRKNEEVIDVVKYEYQFFD